MTGLVGDPVAKYYDLRRADHVRRAAAAQPSTADLDEASSYGGFAPSCHEETCASSELQEGITVVAPLSPSIATMLTLMLSKFHAERAYKHKGKPKKLCTGVVGALINKRFSSAGPKYNVCHDTR
jgi:hypothetical protein